jgi:glutamate/tyrosine decarboxylase-like PLP-dependent enzyme
MNTPSHPFDWAARLAHEVVASEQATPVKETMPPARVTDALDLTLPEEGLTLESVVDKLRCVLMATPSTGSHRFFNQLFGGRDPVAVLGDMIVPVLNNSMYTYKAAGPHVLIEEQLINHMSRYMGFDNPGGIFTPGGSLSNLTAMVVARNECIEGGRETGFTGHRLAVYTSAVSHYSITKAAGMVGVGRQNVRKIPVDSKARMIPEALAKAIEADLKEGIVPIMVNATMGTTVEGAFDMVNPIADICERLNVWLHLDGAYGASMALSPTTAHLLEGSHRADSITWDPHKIMGVPLTCSVILTRDPSVLQRNLSECASYLFQEDADRYNPGVRSIQCGRRNDFLKLWTAWQYHGDAGYARRVESCMALVNHAVQTITKDPLLLLSIEPESMNVCFEVKGSSSEAICETLHHSRRAMVGYGTVSGKETIRVVLVNPEITTDDVDAFFAEVKTVASRMAV